MSITRGQLSKNTGCNAETIRYYEKTGIMPEPARSAAGYRLYHQNHEQRLRFIMRGRELGFATKDLKNLLDLVDRKVVSCGEVSNLARKHLKLVHKKIHDLKSIETTLSKILRTCSGKDVPECPLIDDLFFGSEETWK